MCGRFSLTWNLDELQGRFSFVNEATALDPQYNNPQYNNAKYNIAPTDPVLTVTNDDGQRRGRIMRWGFIPFWAKEAKIGSRMINAVGETAASKPAFRTAFRKRRCLVLADGFYEWKKNGKQRIPNFIFLKSGEPMAFAGLWEIWKSPEGEFVHSCAIITTNSNSFIEPVHSRMPVILSDESEALWLDPLTEDPGILEPLLIPSPPELMSSYVVTDYVNSVRNQGPDCIAPAGASPIGPVPGNTDTGRLFD